MSYYIVARWRAKDGEAGTVEALLRELRTAIRQEPGNLKFDVHRSTKEPDEFLLYEQYRDEQSFLAHRETEHFKRLVLDQAVPRLAAREIQSFALLD